MDATVMAAIIAGSVALLGILVRLLTELAGLNRLQKLNVVVDGFGAETKQREVAVAVRTDLLHRIASRALVRFNTGRLVLAVFFISTSVLTLVLMVAGPDREPQPDTFSLIAVMSILLFGLALAIYETWRVSADRQLLISRWLAND